MATPIVVAQFQIDGDIIYMLDDTGVMYHGRVGDGSFHVLPTDINEDATEAGL